MGSWEVAGTGLEPDDHGEALILGAVGRAELGDQHEEGAKANTASDGPRRFAAALLQSVDETDAVSGATAQGPWMMQDVGRRAPYPMGSAAATSSALAAVHALLPATRQVRRKDGAVIRLAKVRVGQDGWSSNGAWFGHPPRQETGGWQDAE